MWGQLVQVGHEIVEDADRQEDCGLVALVGLGRHDPGLLDQHLPRPVALFTLPAIPVLGADVLKVGQRDVVACRSSLS